MNLFKIVQKITDKSNVKSSPYRDAAALLLFVFLLPYVTACLWGHIGEENGSLSVREKNGSGFIDEKYTVSLSGEWGRRKMSMQEYLIRKLELVLGKEEGIMEYEEEALKAQAVLLRTELWEVFPDDGKDIIIEDDISMHDMDSGGGKEIAESDEDIETIYAKAVRDTDGIFLAYEGKPVKAAFFPVSNGRTREAAEVWENMTYPYLVSVECKQDIKSVDYQSQPSVPKEEYLNIIRDIFGIDESGSDELWRDISFSYDSAGYVREAECRGISLSGETFRKAFDLNSASFSVEWRDKEVIFNVKGVGHGFGMSQYGANERAADGEDFEQILTYYFFQTELAKIE